ncbi:Bug family tripartite tricarboxylate transporter substrate binding protein [Caenimonas soli]|uniref:Bug family tripartite tricarboxylate transporter substrate binding protein n=1 Tax=Caenimonas soli TaxID=2735555 RepID=UPI001555AA61|nr:tripartite tricarboxylate transporter substrate binding protein [Caenimonas soli]NPC54315.1 tripartite tricarboxylate transporter substrate binding protein [Caenimonas soli]
MQFPRRAALGLVLVSAFATAAFAQAWPAKPIKLIVPFPAGGGTDIIGRELGQKLAANTGWTVIVDNKPGSGGNLGVDAAAKSAPDGYTVVLGQTSNLAINPTLYSKLPYDPVKDLAPVSMVASAPLVLVVAADSPYKTLADLVAAARSKPLELNYATSGNGTVAHLATELFQRTANVKLTHVPYKGAAQGATDLIGGQVQIYVSSVPTLIGHIKGGKMRALAVTSAKRADDLPQVPTVAESGYKGFEAVTWFGIAGPAKLPKEVVAKLNAEINKALQAPDLLKKLSDQGADVAGSTPEQFGKLIHDDIARWGKVVKESGAKVD